MSRFRAGCYLLGQYSDLEIILRFSLEKYLAQEVFQRSYTIKVNMGSRYGGNCCGGSFKNTEGTSQQTRR
jgi:hypothetical protein